MEDKKQPITEDRWSIKKNERINRLTLIGPVWLEETGLLSRRCLQFGWFECECGTKKIIKLNSVKYEHTKSCGCLQKEAVIFTNGQKKKGTFAENGVKVCANEDCRNKDLPQPTGNFCSDKSQQDGYYYYCKSCVKDAQYRRLYKKSLFEYEQQLLDQNNVCDFCKLPFDRSNRRLMDVQDHNHASGDNRGIVHSACNFMIESFESFPDMFRKIDFKMANDYFERRKHSNR